MTITQSAELVSFISNIPVSGDGTVPLNSLESEYQFTSDLYESDYSLSVLARKTVDILKSDKIEIVNDPLDQATITGKVLDSDLAAYAPDIYLMVRIIVIESFSLVYNITEQPDQLRYFSFKDVLRIKQNINFVADYFSTQEKYRKFIQPLRDMNVSLGYIQHQIALIMQGGIN